MKIIYSRVSTVEQNVKQQTELLVAQYGSDCKVIEEKASGKNAAARPLFTKMQESLRSGDTVIVYDISRLGRNVLDVLAFCKHCETVGVKVVVHTLGGVDVTSSTGKLVLTTLAAVAEMQRTEMLEKQAIGIERAKSQGKYQGKSVSKESWKEYRDTVDLAANHNMSLTKAIKLTGINQSKFYRLKKLDEAQKAQTTEQQITIFE
ncbi:recombinase family protein [Vibrio diabolicus]|uniref:recombinase family protein n=1 Tax=Vibrio diabolicus TaxID=50719 RepID=UPI00374A80AB